MVDSFNEYLNEKKKSNGYTSEFVLSEGLFGLTGKDKEREAYGVLINFADDAIITHVAKAIQNNKQNNQNQNNQNGQNNQKTIDQQADDEKKKSQKEIREIISTYIQRLAEKFIAAPGHIIAKAKNDYEVIYVFKKYNNKQPKAYANGFVKTINSMSSQQTLYNMSYIAEIAEVVSTDYTNRELKNIEAKVNMFNDPKATALETSDFVKNVTSEIFNKVNERIDRNTEFAKKGNLITVYSIPYKISDESITTLATDEKKKGNKVDAFYDELAKIANKNIVDFLNQLDAEGVKDYLGIVPVKTYGFNLYFKDRDTAEQAAEGLNQDGTDIRVTERKRYEGKIVNRPKVLTDTVALNNGVTVNGVSGAGAWLQGTRFGVEHVTKLIGDIYPDAKTSREVKIATVKVDEDWIKNKLLENNNVTEDDMLRNIQNRIIKPLVDHGKDNFVSVSSEGTSLVFIFTSSTSTDNIETYLNGIVPASKITVRSGRFTEGEITGHQEMMKKMAAVFNINDYSRSMIREKFTSLFNMASKWISADKEDAQKKADADAQKAANAPGALIIQFITDKFKKLSKDAKINLLTAIDKVQLEESFASNLYSYLIEKLHINEGAIDDMINAHCSEEDLKKLAELKTSDADAARAYRHELFMKAKAIKEAKEGKESNTEEPAPADNDNKKETKNNKNTKRPAERANKNTKNSGNDNGNGNRKNDVNGGMTLQDAINHMELVNETDLVKLIAGKIETVMNVIERKTQSEIKVELGKGFSIVIYYQAKAKDRIEKYVNRLQADSAGIIEIKGAKNP
jgi:hypothetical protein